MSALGAFSGGGTLRKASVHEVKCVSELGAQHSQVNNSLLNTASWPDLPKLQNVRHYNQKPSEPVKENEGNQNKGILKNELLLRTCSSSRSNTLKNPAEELGNTMFQTEKKKEIAGGCVALLTANMHAAWTVRKSNTYQEKYDNFQNGRREHRIASGANVTADVSKERCDLPKSSSTKDERRREQARKRSILKEEKKKIREAEILKKRIAPKGQSVRVISHKILEMVLKSDKDSVFVNSKHKCDIAEQNFPTLEEAIKKTKGKYPKESFPHATENEINENKPAISTLPSRKNKHKEPLEIDIHNLLKDSSKKHCDKGYRSGRNVDINVKAKSKRNATPYIGNQLDSSNPERKRGKQRERPKKRRITVLKAAILEARALKGHLRELEQSSKATGFSEIKFCKEQFDQCNNAEFQHTEEIIYSDILSSKGVSRESESETNTNENLNDNLLPAIATTNVPEMTVSALSVKLQDIHLHSSDATSSFQHNMSIKIPFSKEAAEESKKKGIKIIGENEYISLEQAKLSTKSFPQHSRKFREYCDHMLTNDLNNAVKGLIQDIVKFQDRLHQRDPIKAFAKRRYIVGFREVKKYLQLKKLKLVIIAPDLEVARNKGGTNDLVAELKDIANMQCVPYVFALNRRALGYITFKKVGVSCLGVVSYEGTENNFKVINEALAVARMQYNKLSNSQSASTSEKEKQEEKEDKMAISSHIAASLLSKLKEKIVQDETQSTNKASPFLAAIDQVTSEDYSD